MNLHHCQDTLYGMSAFVVNFGPARFLLWFPACPNARVSCTWRMLVKAKWTPVMCCVVPVLSCHTPCTRVTGNDHAQMAHHMPTQHPEPSLSSPGSIQHCLHTFGSDTCATPKALQLMWWLACRGTLAPRCRPC